MHTSSNRIKDAEVIERLLQCYPNYTKIQELMLTGCETLAVEEVKYTCNICIAMSSSISIRLSYFIPSIHIPSFLPDELCCS